MTNYILKPLVYVIFDLTLDMLLHYPRIHWQLKGHAVHGLQQFLKSDGAYENTIILQIQRWGNCKFPLIAEKDKFPNKVAELFSSNFKHIKEDVQFAC